MDAMNAVDHQTELLSDPDTAATEQKSARVAVILFFDYLCVVATKFQSAD